MSAYLTTLDKSLDLVSPFHASLILTAGLVGCGGGDNPSVEPSQETPAISEVAPEVSEETPAVSEEAPAVSEEIPAVSEEEPSVEVPTEVVYETTPALTLDFELTAEPGSDGKIKQELAAGDYVFGDFTVSNVAGDGKVVLETESKTVTVNGEAKEYSKRINNKSSKNMFYFTTEKAGKLVFVARSSGKLETDTRVANVFNDSESVSETVDIPGGTGDKNADFTAFEVVLPEAGDYTFYIDGGASHILDLLVYYAA